jgi:hypothetical protein
MAVETESAGDVERKNNAVSFFYALYRFSDLFDDAHNFVANDRTFFERSTTVVHVEVAATDAAGGDAE